VREKDLFFGKLLESTLPQALYMLIVNTSGIKNINEFPYIEKDATDLFKKNLHHYSKFKWKEELIHLEISHLWDNLFFKGTFLTSYQQNTFLQTIKNDISNPNTKDLFLIRNILSRGVDAVIDHSHYFEPIVLIESGNNIGIVDGIHRIVSLFIQKNTDKINVKAWKGSIEY